MARTRALGGIAHFALRRARRAPRRSIPPQNSETLVAELCHELARECCKEALRAQQTATTAPQLAEQKRRWKRTHFFARAGAQHEAAPSRRVPSRLAVARARSSPVVRSRPPSPCRLLLHHEGVDSFGRMLQMNTRAPHILGKVRVSAAAAQLLERLVRARAPAPLAAVRAARRAVRPSRRQLR
jgi:hypothetical protein